MTPLYKTAVCPWLICKNIGLLDRCHAQRPILCRLNDASYLINKVPLPENKVPFLSNNNERDIHA